MIEQWKNLGWRVVGNDLRKLLDPRRLLYFGFVVVLVGNAGTIISFYQYCRGHAGVNGYAVAGNFATYFIAIAATAFADWTLRAEKDPTVSLVYFLMALGAGAVGTVMLVEDSKTVIKICGAVGGVLALSLWLFISASNREHDDSHAIDALGGTIPPQT